MIPYIRSLYTTEQIYWTASKQAGGQQQIACCLLSSTRATQKHDMGATSARPEWTRSSPGIPIDTVVRLHTGSQGTANRVATALSTKGKDAGGGTCAIALLIQERNPCRRTARCSKQQETCCSCQTRVAAAKTVSLICRAGSQVWPH